MDWSFKKNPNKQKKPNNKNTPKNSYLFATDLDDNLHWWAIPRLPGSVFREKAITKTCRHCPGGCCLRGSEPALGSSRYGTMSYLHRSLPQMLLNLRQVSVWGLMHFQLEVLCFEPVCCCLLWKHLSESKSKALEVFWSHYWWQG